MRFCVTTVSKFKYLSGYKKRVKHFNRTISPEISGNNLNVVISDQPILSLLPLTFSFYISDTKIIATQCAQNKNEQRRDPRKRIHNFCNV